MKQQTLTEYFLQNIGLITPKTTTSIKKPTDDNTRIGNAIGYYAGAVAVPHNIRVEIQAAQKKQKTYGFRSNSL